MPYLVVSHPTMGPVASSVRIASRFGDKLLGLMGAKDLGPGEGMLFEHTNAVHGCFTCESLTLVYLNRQQIIVEITTLRPWRMGPIVPRAYWVLELSIRTTLTGVHPGDTLTWVSQPAQTRPEGREFRIKPSKR